MRLPNYVIPGAIGALALGVAYLTYREVEADKQAADEKVLAIRRAMARGALLSPADTYALSQALPPRVAGTRPNLGRISRAVR